MPRLNIVILSAFNFTSLAVGCGLCVGTTSHALKLNLRIMQADADGTEMEEREWRSSFRGYTMPIAPERNQEEYRALRRKYILAGKIAASAEESEIEEDHWILNMIGGWLGNGLDRLEKCIGADSARRVQT